MASETQVSSQPKHCKLPDIELPQQLTVVIDPISYPYLQTATIDYVINEQGQQFVVHNPQAKTTCGYGSSFSA